MDQIIPTYIINLKKRTDRKDFVTREFQGRREFDILFVEAYEHCMQSDNTQGLAGMFGNEFQNLGEIQTLYQSFTTAWQQYTDYVINGFYSRKKKPACKRYGNASSHEFNCPTTKTSCYSRQRFS